MEESTDPSWLIPSYGSGTGSASVPYRVLPNDTGMERSATISVGTHGFLVTQSAGPCAGCTPPPPCSYVVSVVGPSGSGFQSIQVETAANCSWTATVDTPEISVVPDAGMGPGVVTVTISSATAMGTVTIADHLVPIGPASGTAEDSFCIPLPARCNPESPFPLCMLCPPIPKPPGFSSPRVEILQADLAHNRLRVKLSGGSGPGWLNVIVLREGSQLGIDVVASGYLGAGTHDLEFSYNTVNTLRVGQYDRVVARWLAAKHEFHLRFMVLGVYHHTQYNVPSESECSNGAVAAFLEDAQTCAFPTNVLFRPRFAPLAWDNGHGRSIDQGIITRPWTCSGYQGLADGNWFRQVDAVLGAFGVAVDDQTIAIRWHLTDPNRRHPHLRYGDDVLIVGYGQDVGAGSIGTLKTVKDKCGDGCDDDLEHHVDNFTSLPWCSSGKVGDLGTGHYLTIPLR